MINPKKAIVLVAALLLCQLLSSQCLTDRHNTSSRTAWVSCTPADSPNADRGMGHWLHFNLHYSYALEETHFWNYNHPDSLLRGADQIAVDISDDGNTWQEVAVVSVPVASGLSDYEGFAGPDLGGIRARYVLLTLLSNHGDACFAIGEFRVGVQDEIQCVLEHSLTGDLTTRKYEAMESIQSDGQVLTGEILRFEAGEEVVLNHNFQILDGAVLDIVMQGCDNN